MKWREWVLGALLGLTIVNFLYSLDGGDKKVTNDQVYMQGMIAKGLIEAMGMHAENMQRQVQGDSMAYTMEDFQKVIEENGIHHNAILTQLQGR